MKGSKIKLHRQTAMTPGQVHVKGGRRREQGALLVARCASSTCLDEAQKIAWWIIRLRALESPV